jgi:hypothetical protein
MPRPLPHHALCLATLTPLLLLGNGQRLVGTNNTKPLEYEEDDEMAYQLISAHLLPAFRAARDTRGQDRAAFAIQVPILTAPPLG